MTRPRWTVGTAALIAAAVVAGCSNSGSSSEGSVDISKLDVGKVVTAPRVIAGPSEKFGHILESIRMADAVTDSTDFAPLQLYTWNAAIAPDTQGLLPVLGPTSKPVLDSAGYLAGYRVVWGDRPLNQDGSTPPNSVSTSISVFRVRDDRAAKDAAASLDSSSWKDLGKTQEIKFPDHPELPPGRFTPGSGVLAANLPVGSFVVRILMEVPAAALDMHRAEFVRAVTAELDTLKQFTPTPADKLAALPVDPDDMLANMVYTDPAKPADPAGNFADYGRNASRNMQTPLFHLQGKFKEWGVDAVAVSGDQRLYRLKDHDAAKLMLDQFQSDALGAGSVANDADPQLADSRCSQYAAAPPAFRYTCRIAVGKYYTAVAAETPLEARQKIAAQYVLLHDK